MGKTVCRLLALLLAAGTVRAEIKTPDGAPIEITAAGETRYENGLATARDNVAIHVGDTDIYADYAQYDSHTHEVIAEGNVRIYRDISLYLAERAVYNTETKQIRGEKGRTSSEPYFLTGENIKEISENGYLIRNGTFTTEDATTSDFHLRARTIRIYQNDRAIFRDVTFFVGDVPIFWWPYLYQSLNDSFSFTASPAFLSSWGPSLLTQVMFPITDHAQARLRLDYRGRRGEALGFESEIHYGPDDKSVAKLKTYYLQDQNPLVNRTGLPRGAVPTGRYRVGFEDRTNFTDDIYGIVDVTKLSDPYVMQDFYQNEFRLNPVPDNVVAVTKSDPFYTISATARFQANEFFETTERLPEIAFDIKRHALFGSPIFYEGETSFANLRLAFPDGSGFENYRAVRLDTFHQLTYPNTYFGWLSVVPRVGFRATYYDRSRDFAAEQDRLLQLEQRFPSFFLAYPPNSSPLVPDFLLPNPTLEEYEYVPRYGRTEIFPGPIEFAGSTVRTVFDTGAEASFKLSRKWEDVQSRAVGLDGLMHVIQPFSDFSFVATNKDPTDILQFDRFQPSTQLRAIDFPQFTPIDSIAGWTVLRAGVRNKLETRRDDSTVTWFELDTYFDVNFDNPYDRSDYSNLFNDIRFTPLPWATLVINSQVPAFNKGFTEVNTSVNIQPTADLQINVGHRYLNDNPFFLNSSLIVVGGYYRLNDNWGVGVQEQYEEATGVLEQQRYAVYRDLTNWVASFGAVIRDNAGVKEYGVLFTITLKAFPKFGFDLNFDPGSSGQ